MVKAAWGEREARAVRKILKCLRLSLNAVDVLRDANGPYRLSINDSELSKVFSVPLDAPSKWLQQIKALHEEIYHARAKEKYRLQNGLCAECKRPLRGSGECDHIIARARGRDDRLKNLKIVCAALSGGCTYHHDRHSKGQRT